MRDMAIEDILKKMDDEGAEKIAELRADYEAKLKALEKEYSETLKRIQSENKAQAEAHKSAIKENLLSKARMELRLKLLEEKRKILNSVFAEAFENIKALPEKEYLGLFFSRLEQLNFNSGEFIVGHEDYERFAKALLEHFGNQSFTVKMDKSFSRGFILRTGKIQYDFRLDRIFEELRERLEDRIARLLFG